MVWCVLGLATARDQRLGPGEITNLILRLPIIPLSPLPSLIPPPLPPSHSSRSSDNRLFLCSIIRTSSLVCFLNFLVVFLSSCCVLPHSSSFSSSSSFAFLPSPLALIYIPLLFIHLLFIDLFDLLLFFLSSSSISPPPPLIFFFFVKLFIFLIPRLFPFTFVFALSSGLLSSFYGSVFPLFSIYLFQCSYFPRLLFLNSLVRLLPPLISVLIFKPSLQ